MGKGKNGEKMNLGKGSRLKRKARDQFRFYPFTLFPPSPSYPFPRLSCYLEIVKRDFGRAAGIESGNAAPEILVIGNPIDILAVDIKR